MEALECLEDHDGLCEGAVEYRMPLSGTGRSFPRCSFHWDKRLEIQEGIQARYGGDLPPDDFDPSYAGERWDEDY